MIFVDSSVWIDYFNGKATPETDFLDDILGVKPIVIGDIILTEVLQGFRNNKDYEQAKKLLLSLPVYELLNQEMSIKCAHNYRSLRKKRITIRKTIDTIIATYCIANRLQLLFSDRDFNPFVEKLGLKTAI